LIGISVAEGHFGGTADRSTGLQSEASVRDNAFAKSRGNRSARVMPRRLFRAAYLRTDPRQGITQTAVARL